MEIQKNIKITMAIPNFELEFLPAAKNNLEICKSKLEQHVSKLVKLVQTRARVVGGGIQKNLETWQSAPWKSLILDWLMSSKLRWCLTTPWR